MRYFPIFLFFLISIPYVHAQKKERTFDEVYFDVAVNVTGQNPQEAIRISDSLYHKALTPVHQVRSLMLKANIYYSIGDLKKAINIASQAEKLAESNKMVEGQAKILGFLSTQHRNLGLLKKGRTYLEKGIKLSRTFTDKNKFLQYYGLALQEMAYYNHDEKKNKEALVVLNKADSVFQLLGDQNDKFFFLATNEEMQGKEYLILKKFNQSLQHYSKSENYLKQAKADQSGLLGFIYNGKGEAYFSEKKLDSALYYYEQSRQIAEKSEHSNLKPLIYENLAEYYFQAGNIKEYNFYTKLKDSIASIQNLRNQKISDDILEDLSNDADQLKLSSRNIILVFILLLVISGTALFVNIAMKRKLKKKIRLILQELEQNDSVFLPETIHSEIEESADDDNDGQNNKQQMVPVEIEMLILKKLGKFERKAKFNNKNISLSSLAVSLETNKKYLSQVINKSKNCDFNSYINGLRINYIVNKMRTDPNYLNYKLSYLAEECGFSSHSKFSAVFKTIIGVSPSDFIRYIKNENLTEVLSDSE